MVRNLSCSIYIISVPIHWVWYLMMSESCRQTKGLLGQHFPAYTVCHTEGLLSELETIKRTLYDNSYHEWARVRKSSSLSSNWNRRDSWRLVGRFVHMGCWQIIAKEGVLTFRRYLLHPLTAEGPTVPWVSPTPFYGKYGITEFYAKYMNAWCLKHIFRTTALLFIPSWMHSSTLKARNQVIAFVW